MSDIATVAKAFFDACETGGGWEACERYCTPDATFSAQATRTDGIVRAIGPFTIVASGGDKVTGVGTLVGVGPTLNVHPVGFIMTITGGTGRFANASGTLVTAPLVTPITPFTPPLLFERLEGAVHGYISY